LEKSSDEEKKIPKMDDVAMLLVILLQERTHTTDVELAVFAPSVTTSADAV